MSLTLPIEFIKRMKEMLGDEFDAFLKSYDENNDQGLRINRLKGSRDHFINTCDFSDSLSPVPWTCDGLYYPDLLRPGKHPYHEAGVYYIQEPSAMLPAALLAANPGDRVLDLCAAPGGKSTQIASDLQQSGLLISNEIHPARAKILSENIERMGIRNSIVTNETPQNLAAHFPSYFDRIMVDAPCSGEGMFRKNEEAIKQWSLENVSLCAERQDEILDCADRMLRPGGIMVYSTCTFAPDENEGSVSRFLERHPNYEVLEQKRLWPHKIKGEGHFAALLQKNPLPGDAFTPHSIPLPKGSILLRENRIMTDSGNKKKGKSSAAPDWSVLHEFFESTLTTSLNGRIELFGEQIYLLPEDAPSLNGLRVLRPGLHLGTMRKNRFEPSHALALSLTPEQVTCAVSLSHLQENEYRLACDYLGGQTFPLDGAKGWYLICLDGYSLGWGKLAGQVMKNHYPKGLRKTV